MNPRFEATAAVCERPKQIQITKHDAIISPHDNFGAFVFTRQIMQKMLPPNIYKNLVAATDGKESINPDYADSIAVAIKEWATSLGATHYTHWFQPLTGASAEKHDAFIEPSFTPDKVVEKFTGEQLLQGEPDASSFPSGGLRSTYEARGYTGWDPTSPVFVWKGGDGITLCIPSVFFSWTGDILDTKIPLIRSETKLNRAVMRLLKLTGIDAKHIFTTLGLEQEYFVVDRSLRNLRPDLLLTGRTVFGTSPPKGQELQDHYFATVKDRILSFMHDFESKALKLGIPVKTRHNEVAPGQHEVAHIFEKATAAIDHNILMMEVMRQTAEKHQLTCLLHEKPFQGLNGSGKHSNWSIMTDTGINLLNPTDTPENNLHFLILLTAILSAVHRHPSLLRASIGSASNDYRLGGHEAPPAIISVYLGEDLETVLDNIEKSGGHKSERKNNKYKLSLTVLPELAKHTTDRNRTSPFAFTGNKFEFRAVGSSSSPAFPITVLNAIVAESLDEILEEIEQKMPKKDNHSLKETEERVIPVLRTHLSQSRDVRFPGDNYSIDWEKLAKKRNLPNQKKSPEAYKSLTSASTVKAFKDVLTKEELTSRYEICMETYIQTLEIEIKTMLDLFHTQIFPAAMKTQSDFSKAIERYKRATGSSKALPAQLNMLEKLGHAIDQSLQLANELDEQRRKAVKIDKIDLKGEYFSEEVLSKAEEFRVSVDFLETLVNDKDWPLPKYRELLFLI